MSQRRNQMCCSLVILGPWRIGHMIELWTASFLIDSNALDIPSICTKTKLIFRQDSSDAQVRMEKEERRLVYCELREFREESVPPFIECTWAAAAGLLDLEGPNETLPIMIIDVIIHKFYTWCNHCNVVCFRTMCFCWLMR